MDKDAKMIKLMTGDLIINNIGEYGIQCRKGGNNKYLPRMFDVKARGGADCYKEAADGKENARVNTMKAQEMEADFQLAHRVEKQQENVANTVEYLADRRAKRAAGNGATH